MKAPEEAGHIALEHIAARREKRRSWRDLSAKRQEAGLVAARAVEKKNRREGWVGAGLEAMNVG
jgi:hypothetical protein